VGWLAASLVVHLGRPLIARITVLVGRLTDPLVAPVWTRVASRVPSSREPGSTA